MPVLHLDIKPENVMLCENRTKAKLGDNGLAMDLTSSSVSFNGGTLAYICPLGFRRGTRTMSSDIYSLGLVLLQLIFWQPDVGKVKQAIK